MIDFLHTILSKPFFGFFAGAGTIILSILHFLPLALGIASGVFALIASVYSLISKRYEKMKNKLEYEKTKNASN